MRFSKEDEAKLYYLYMMADGQVSKEEKKLFQSICMKLGIKADDKHAIMKEYDDLMEYEDLVFETIVGLIEGKTNDTYGCNSAFYVTSILNSRWKETVTVERSARILWNLINLGYADSVYSPSEKKIVNYLVEQWQIKPEVYQEFVDTADTMLTLSKQKKWIETTYPDSEKKTNKEKQIDKEMKLLAGNVELTIQELVD